MESATERKSFVRRLWADGIGQAISSVEGTFGSGDTSPPATDDSRSAESGEADTDPRPFLTPEERILQLVSQHGGKIKQAEIVAHVEWSESTVSRKLQKLESTADVTRFQIGREKVVYLEGNEPAALKSPFADGEGDAPLAD